QRRDGRRVVGQEVGGERVVPVKNDHPIITEYKPGQLRGRERGEGVPVSRNRVRKDGRVPGVVSLEYGVVVWRCRAIGKRVINRVTGDQRKVIRPVTQG